MLSPSWKRDIASGLIVLVPLLITAYVVAFIYQAIANLPFLEATLGGLPVIARVFITLLLFGLLVLAVGYLMRTTVGDILEELLDGAMNRLPGLRVVYNASKMAVETAVSGPDELQTPVKLEIWNGMRMTAFKTGKTTDDGRDVLFLPTAPNITTGYVIEVESDVYTEIDETVEDSLTRILSAGFGENEDRGIDINVTEESLLPNPERSETDEG
ncbi:MAG: putative membrane protein [Natronomonas sp.]|jgi:uncharacterized membrane protein|uniref:DUF502 domain-containing protein n=1 Tax=Natronomonas sp. TaxID=2184060 RepID=UPI0039895B58